MILTTPFLYGRLFFCSNGLSLNTFRAKKCSQLNLQGLASVLPIPIGGGNQNDTKNIPQNDTTIVAYPYPPNWHTRRSTTPEIPKRVFAHIHMQYAGPCSMVCPLYLYLFLMCCPNHNIAVVMLLTLSPTNLCPLSVEVCPFHISSNVT